VYFYDKLFYGTDYSSCNSADSALQSALFKKLFKKAAAYKTPQVIF
jgi:hypothetical protein